MLDFCRQVRDYFAGEWIGYEGNAEVLYDLHLLNQIFDFGFQLIYVILEHDHVSI